ncbi:hypothetical protein LZP73_08985 [Shewanella sp. AS16]|uniref:hypothetical protein n=1 Tax=Shewanella sp. AS16 TaxID=2907625 RepID=UPI001F17C761|nr:hypothetical protein [Shewanella sp. AS16]MCE9686345.1 hypothetical protein [Shewanella sp. AS16]
MKKIYSPLQAASGALLGGPIAAVVFIKNNFDTLANVELSKKTLSFGTVFILCVLAMLPFLPEKLPNYLIPILMGVSVRSIVEKYQLTKEDIKNSEEFDFHSNWRVFGLSLLFMVLFLVVGLGYLMMLSLFGFEL